MDFRICVLAAAVASSLWASEPNYDESKVPPYELESPIAFADGRKLKSPGEWPARRREILEIFAREMYGQPPPAPESVVTEVADERVAVAGYAIRRQVKMWFRKDKSGPCVNWTIWRPRHAKAPSPVILMLNYRGAFEMVTDKDLPVPSAWCLTCPRVKDHRAQESSRGWQCETSADSIFPVGTILAHGYAVMTACYAELSPDPFVRYGEKESLAYTGVFDLWPKRDESRIDNTTALGAWAWGLSRGLDYAESAPDLDAKRSVVTGCSRLGKSALLAAARDERFAVCVPNQTGGGGAPLAKRVFGESVYTETRSFPHWYCKAYAKYADNESAMKFDQHLLLAAVAPRHLLVEGFDQKWFDTKGEFLACRAASAAWEFLGLPGLPKVEWPDDFDESAVGPRLGYVRRSENHGMSAHDWKWILDFADRAFGKR